MRVYQNQLEKNQDLRVFLPDFLVRILILRASHYPSSIMIVEPASRQLMCLTYWIAFYDRSMIT